MKESKLLFIIWFFISILTYAQKSNEYKFLSEGQYNSKIYEKLESKSENKVYVWHKIENTLENDPSTEFTEYYLQIKCDSKTSVLKKLIIHWRDGSIEKHDDSSDKEVPIDQKSILELSYQNHCIK